MRVATGDREGPARWRPIGPPVRRARTASVPDRLRGTARDRLMITPEGIALPITLASWGARVAALALDFGFIFTIMIATTLGLATIAGGVGHLFGHARDNTALGRAIEFLFILWIVALFLLRYAYFLAFELGPRGATWGKRITGIRIAARDGGRLTAEMVIARNLLRDIELFLPLVMLGAASGDDRSTAGLIGAAWFLIFALMPLFNRDRLRAGDIIAGSWVVEAPRRRLEPALSHVSGTAVAGYGGADAAFVFTDAELSVYGEYELQTLERLLRDDQAEALASVQEAIAAKIGREPLPREESRPFLSAYYLALRARLEAGMRLGRRRADKFG